MITVPTLSHVLRKEYGETGEPPDPYRDCLGEIGLYQAQPLKRSRAAFPDKNKACHKFCGRPCSILNTL